MKDHARRAWITLCAGFCVCLIIAEVHGQADRPTPAPRGKATLTTKPILPPKPTGTESAPPKTRGTAPPPPKTKGTAPLPPKTKGTAPPRPEEPPRRTDTLNTTEPSEHPNYADHCIPNPCKNSGTCIVQNNKAVCLCAPGYNPKKWCEECPDGSFGDECKQKCYGCDHRRDCHHVTGCRRCSRGYAPRSVPTCDKFDCTRSDPCLNGAPCHKTKGCTCPRRWTGRFCETRIDTSDLEACKKIDDPCVSGKCFYIEALGASNKKETICMCYPPRHGEKCERTDCLEKSENCVNGGCTKEENHAEPSCKCFPGYQGVHCGLDCPRNSYGLGCNQECGHCQVLPCDKVDGSCGVRGCDPGWTGVLCKTQLPGAAGENVRVRGGFQAEGEFLRGFGDRTSAEFKSLRKSTKRFLTQGARRLRASTIRVADLVFSNGSVVTEYTMDLQFPKEQASSLGDVAANLNRNLKENIKDFQSEFNLTINPSSISAREVEVQASQDTSKSFMDSSYIYVAGGFLTICVVVIVVIIASRRKNRTQQPRLGQGRIRSRYIRSISSSGRSVRP